MKKIVFLFLILLINACRPLDTEEIGYYLEVFVGDATDFGVEGVTVTLFASQDDFAKDTNPIIKAQTDSKGLVLFKNLSPNTYAYFVSAELGEQNNWEENKLVAFTRIDEQAQNYKTKIKGSIANKIAGRLEKRWRQTAQFLNNSPNDNCNGKTEQVFRRDWFVKIYNGTNCPDAGKQVGQDIWAVTSDNRGLIRGVPGGASEQRLTILELSNTKMVYSESPIPGLTITSEFVAVN
ncbi:MAG: hypothetical protein EAZ08_04615 [Cytophagales bacterium]|nr:MAG: hypothetical protein EAZ08_04615 [Cytophagales bacterium]